MTSFFSSPVYYSIPEEFQIEDLHYCNKVSGILVLCNPIDLSEEKTFFLSKVLKSVNIDIDQISLGCIRRDQRFRINHLTKHSNSKKVLSFGLQSHQLGIIPLLTNYEIHSSERFQILLTDSLTDIMNDANKKKQLWNQLKKMFL